MTPVLRAVGRLAVGSGLVPIDVAADARRIAFIGPSGVGKSTLLRALLGFTDLDHVAVRGVVWQGPSAKVPPWARGVGWAPQDGTLLPHASVRENLVWGAPDADPRPVADALGVGDLLDRRPRNLSSGERQRVAIGRALLAARSLLVLDEPFSALDPERRASVAAYVDDEARRRDLPVVLVSHDAEDVRRLADVVYRLTERALRPEVR